MCEFETNRKLEKFSNSFYSENFTPDHSFKLQRELNIRIPVYFTIFIIKQRESNKLKKKKGFHCLR